jgi:hypothetical protein
MKREGAILPAEPDRRNPQIDHCSQRRLMGAAEETDPMAPNELVSSSFNTPTTSRHAAPSM